jgi:hypothetical protein
LPRLAGGGLLPRLLTLAAVSQRPTVGRFDITGAQAAPLWIFYARKRLPQLPVRDNYAHGGVLARLHHLPATTIVLQMIGIAAGVLLLIGLWTPVAGALAAVVKVWIALSRYFSHSGDPWIAALRRSSARSWRWSDQAHGHRRPAVWQVPHRCAIN